MTPRHIGRACPIVEHEAKRRCLRRNAETAQEIGGWCRAAFFVVEKMKEIAQFGGQVSFAQ